MLDKTWNMHIIQKFVVVRIFFILKEVFNIPQSSIYLLKYST